MKRKIAMCKKISEKRKWRFPIFSLIFLCFVESLYLVYTWNDFFVSLQSNEIK